jgi:hypothetical protein
MKLSTTPFLVTSNFTVFGHADAFITKEDAIKFAVEKGNKSVWFKPTGQRKILPNDKAKKVF